MVAQLAIFLILALAAFESLRYWRVRTRKDVDIFELEDHVNWLMKRAKSETARERSQLRRSLEDRPTVDTNDVTPIPRSSIGGVVKHEIVRTGSHK